MTLDSGSPPRAVTYADVVAIFLGRSKPSEYGLQPIPSSIGAVRTWAPSRGWRSDWELDHEVVALRNAAREGDEDAVWAAIAFLDADPYLFRSGYQKKRLAKALQHVPLTPDQGEVLSGIAIRLIRNGPRGVGYFRDLARLVGSLATADTASAVQALASNANPRVGGRAALVLDKIEAARTAKARPTNVR